MSFGIDEAQIVALFLESVFYGIFLTTFPPCIYTLLWSNGHLKKPSTIRWSMLFVAATLAVFATLDTALGLLHNIQAFILYKGAGGAIEEFADISDWVNVMKSVNCLIQVLIGDAVWIYRCWIIYSKSYWIILVPLVIWSGCAALAALHIFFEITLHTQTLQPLYVSQLKPIVMSFWLLTVVQNVIVTTLIIWRIWLVDRETAKCFWAMAHATTRPNTSVQMNGAGGIATLRRSRLQRVMRIVIESGLMYTVTALLSVCTYIAGSNAFNGVTDVEVQIIAIAFNLIIIRAANQTEEEYKLTHPPRPMVFDSALESVPGQGGTLLGSEHGTESSASGAGAGSSCGINSRDLREQRQNAPDEELREVV